MKHRSSHTKVLVHRIPLDEIRAFSSLLCHKGKNSTVGLDFLERFGLFHKGEKVAHHLDQVDNGVVAVHLSQDGLRKSEIGCLYNIHRTYLVYGGEDFPCHVRVRVNLEISSRRDPILSS